MERSVLEWDPRGFFFGFLGIRSKVTSQIHPSDRCIGPVVPALVEGPVVGTPNGPFLISQEDLIAVPLVSEHPYWLSVLPLPTGLPPNFS